MYLTRVHTVLEGGEVFFPVMDKAGWEQVWEEFHPEDEQHQYSFTFQHFKRLKP
ncbi:MAG TPA: dihydrofolate reductase [Chitinophagaceae bacterium]|nr:dihydrofolate reductase [Chitinophagaceae bacterium]